MYFVLEVVEFDYHSVCIKRHSKPAIIRFKLKPKMRFYRYENGKIYRSLSLEKGEVYDAKGWFQGFFYERIEIGIDEAHVLVADGILKCLNVQAPLDFPEEKKEVVPVAKGLSYWDKWQLKKIEDGYRGLIEMWGMLLETCQNNCR